MSIEIAIDGGMFFTKASDQTEQILRGETPPKNVDSLKTGFCCHLAKANVCPFRLGEALLA
ncbi:MAG: hypothetical protein KC592_00110 [Nitrospira sp.]|nr:hypothetical protein [Nitrospira sp.]